MPLFVGCYFVLVGYAIFCALDSYIDQWREESKETAKNVKELMRRVDSIEFLIKLYKKD
jgi:hypothetical protein